MCEVISPEDRMSPPSTAASDEAMRAPHRPLGDDRPSVQQPGDAMDRRDLDRLVASERRKNGRQPAPASSCRSWRTDQQYQPAGRCDLERALGVLLAAHLREISAGAGCGAEQRRHPQRRDRAPPGAQMAHRRASVRTPNTTDAGERRFLGVGFR
jgi:hypothetical protein